MTFTLCLIGACLGAAVADGLWDWWRKRHDPYRSVNP